jgi:hypothetical protein
MSALKDKVKKLLAQVQAQEIEWHTVIMENHAQYEAFLNSYNEQNNQHYVVIKTYQ